jgi:hypothetical protein
MTMTLKRIILATSLAAAGMTLVACEKKEADGAGVAQGRAPEGTISDELPNLDLLPNDAPLADPADVAPAPSAQPAPAAAPSAPAPAQPAPAEPPVEGSIAE